MHPGLGLLERTRTCEEELEGAMHSGVLSLVERGRGECEAGRWKWKVERPHSRSRSGGVQRNVKAKTKD